MNAYDVIATVAQDALTSDPKGSYAVAMFADRDRAFAYTARASECCTIPGIAYAVHPVDDLDPERFPTLQMVQRSEALAR